MLKEVIMKRHEPGRRTGGCSSCGTPLYMREDGDINYEIAIGRLDDPNKTPLTKQGGVESKASWFGSLASLPRMRTQDDEA
jgi:hypothetical protein